MTAGDNYLKVPEVAAILRADETTIRRRIRSGEILATKPCGQYLVAEAEVERVLAAARVTPAPAARPQRAAPTLPAPPTGRAPGGSFRSRRRKEAA